MNKTISSRDVYYQPRNIPENLIIWQDENKGIKALMQAAIDITNGETVSFALCTREGTQTPVIAEVMTFAKDSDGFPRYCGENKDPDGPGSSALIASWYDYTTDPIAISTALSLAFRNYPLYFRLA